MDVNQFTAQYPAYSFDFEQPISMQPRVYDPVLLASLPAELAPSFEYRGGGRGRPNLNQTLTHSQCATCQHVLRNDAFYTPPSMIRRNVVFSHCCICTQAQNAERHDLQSDRQRKRHGAIWQYLAPRCLICGFDKHWSAMDLHHSDDESNLVALINNLAIKPDAYRADKLLHESMQSIALCSNCHRMIHANVLPIPSLPKHPAYHLGEFLKIVKVA